MTRPLLDTAVAVHHTATVDQTWDKGTQEGRLASPLTVATAKAMYGWYDPTRIEDGHLPKDACSLPHHEVSTDGQVGPANLAGCRAALARLGQSNIPTADHETIRAHLHAHMADGMDGGGMQGGGDMGNLTPRVTDAAWYSIRNTAADTAEILLYNEVGLWGTSAGEFIKDLNTVRATHLDVRLNTPGGEVFDGLAIYNALRRHPAQVTVHVDGLAASIASVIAMAGDRVLIDRYAQMMIHEAHAVAVGAASDMNSMASLLEGKSADIAAIYAEHAGGTPTQWRDRMRAETWFNAQEAVSAGLADEVVGASGRTAVRNAMSWDLSVFRHAGRAAAPAPLLAQAADPPIEEPESEQTDEPAEPNPTPPTAPPVEEPLIQPELDPDAFGQAIQAATQIPFDPGEFGDLMAAVARDVPAPPPPAPRPVDLGPPLPTPPPPPPPTQAADWAELFRAAITTASTTVPAPGVTSPPQPDETPELRIDRTEFELALRRARL